MLNQQNAEISKEQNYASSINQTNNIESKIEYNQKSISEPVKDFNSNCNPRSLAAQQDISSTSEIRKNDDM